jgi:drug/metabolite transporter (DMT)-like permease
MIILLLASILSSTLILWLFRIFARKNIDLLQAIVANYVVAGTLGWIFFPIKGHDFVQWLPPALMLGLLFILLFVLMGRSTHLFGMGLTSVVVKMSVAIPILAGIVLYNDSMGWWKLSGIILAFVGIFLVSPARSARQDQPVWILIVLFLGSGLLDSLLKWSEHHYVPPGNAPQFSSTIFAFAAGFGFLLFMAQRKNHFDQTNWLWGAILGIPNFFSIYFLVRLLGLDGMESSWIFPVNNMGIVVLSTLMGVVLFHEKFSFRMRLGFALCLFSILILGLSL